MGVSNPTGKRLKNIKDSAVSDHLLQCNCTIFFDHFEILATNVSKFNLLGKESLFIKRDKQNKKLLTIITKRSILDVAAVLGPSL